MKPRANTTLLLRLWNFLHHHWRGALEWRGKIVFREETLHLLMAGVIGFIGGSVNLFFFYAGEMVHRFFLPRPIDPVQAANSLGLGAGLRGAHCRHWRRGLILYLGFRLVGPQGSSDLLEVVVAGDGRAAEPRGVAVMDWWQSAAATLLSARTMRHRTNENLRPRQRC